MRGDTSDSCGCGSSLTLGATGKVPSKSAVQPQVRLSSCNSGPMAEGQRETAPLMLGQGADSPGLVRSLLSLMPFNPEELLCPQGRMSSTSQLMFPDQDRGRSRKGLLRSPRTHSRVCANHSHPPWRESLVTQAPLLQRRQELCSPGWPVSR